MLFTFTSSYLITIVGIVVGLFIGGSILKALWNTDKHFVIVGAMLVLAVVLHSQIS